MTKRVAALGGALALLAGTAAWSPAFAQGSPAQAPPAAQGKPQEGEKKDASAAILEPAAGGYAYNPGQRRDPFVSLLKPVTAAGGPGKKKGMEGFLIQEVALKGIVKTPDGYIAMLLGTDGNSYFCRVGQRLFDGQIIAMDLATVTFRQDVTDPLSPVRTRELKKTLYPSEEARQ